MLSITKVKSAVSSQRGPGYCAYLDHLDDDQAFDEYARTHELGGPLPFWFGGSVQELGLTGVCKSEEVGNLAQGLHPHTGSQLVRGAGRSHVMGADLTFSCPKDVSVLFAGADAKTQADIVRAMHGSVKEALGYAQSIAITRHGKGGAIKQLARSVVASVYTHFASRALDPQLHAHAFLFNVGQRNDGSWSALEHRAQFEHKMATGILFRVELAHRLKSLGFEIEPEDGLFTISGISGTQREALSKRSQELHEALKKAGSTGTAAAKDAAALATRGKKDEPRLPDLLAKFASDAKALGLTPDRVRALQAIRSSEPFSVDHKNLLDELTASSSVITQQQMLRAICTKAMGHWSAQECLQELERLVKSPLLVHLGATDTLTQVFTSRSMLVLESDISARVDEGKSSTRHRISPQKIKRAFLQLSEELSKKIGTRVDLKEQLDAALHVCHQTGTHAFVEGWAGAGKTTMLKAIGRLYQEEGFSIVGTALSASAALNLEREAGIKSSTLAGLLIAIEQGAIKLSARDVVVLDEAGLVDSRTWSLLQKHVVASGAKLVAIGDPKQLQPIEAGGIFKSLCERHGAAQVSKIQRQKTDFTPLLKYLTSPGSKGVPPIVKEQAQALWDAPEDARLRALEVMAKESAQVARALIRWRDRFDHEWLRVVVQHLATGKAREALELLHDKGHLHLISDKEEALDSLISKWSGHKAAIKDRTIIAATRVDADSLNAKARATLTESGVVNDSQGVDLTIRRSDDSTDIRRFAPGDRIVFTKNDYAQGLINGLIGSIEAIDRTNSAPHLLVRLDEKNIEGLDLISVPCTTAHLDHAYCITNYKAQGRTVETAFVFVDPRYADREWSYVAASRSKFSTELFVHEGALHPVDEEAHHQRHEAQSSLELLAHRMSRSRAKGTTLDYELRASDIRPSGVMARMNLAVDAAMNQLNALLTAKRPAAKVHPVPEESPELKI